MYKINVNVINKYDVNSKLFSKKDIKKMNNDATIDDKEEYFVIKAINNQAKQKNNPSLSDKAKTIPRRVATPFPPLNFIQTGNICPRKVRSPEK